MKPFSFQRSAQHSPQKTHTAINKAPPMMIFVSHAAILLYIHTHKKKHKTPDHGHTQGVAIPPPKRHTIKPYTSVLYINTAPMRHTQNPSPRSKPQAVVVSKNITARELSREHPPSFIQQGSTVNKRSKGYMEREARVLCTAHVKGQNKKWGQQDCVGCHHFTRHRLLLHWSSSSFSWAYRPVSTGVSSGCIVVSHHYWAFIIRCCRLHKGDGANRAAALGAALPLSESPSNASDNND